MQTYMKKYIFPIRFCRKKYSANVVNNLIDLSHNLYYVKLNNQKKRETSISLFLIFIQ